MVEVCWGIDRLLLDGFDPVDITYWDLFQDANVRSSILGLGFLSDGFIPQIIHSLEWSWMQCNHPLWRAFFSSELRDSLTQSLVKRSDWRKWKSKQFNRPVKKTGHNCLNHSLKAEVPAVEKGCFIAACFRLSGWSRSLQGWIHVEGQWSAKHTARCFVTVTWSFVFLYLFVVGPCHCHANKSHTVKLATICGKLFRRLLIYYCTYIYRFISLTYSFCLPFVAKGNLDATHSPLKCPNCGILCWQSHVTIYLMQIHETKGTKLPPVILANLHLQQELLCQMGNGHLILSNIDVYTRWVFLFPWCGFVSPLSGWVAQRHAQVAEQGL